MIIHENPTEERILLSDAFRNASRYILHERGQPKQTIQEHTEQMLAFIERQYFKACTAEIA